MKLPVIISSIVLVAAGAFAWPEQCPTITVNATTSTVPVYASSVRYDSYVKAIVLDIDPDNGTSYVSVAKLIWDGKDDYLTNSIYAGTNTLRSIIYPMVQSSTNGSLLPGVFEDEFITGKFLVRANTANTNVTVMVTPVLDKYMK